MVHDVLQTEKDHDKLGAEVLMNMNLPHEAELVRRHMTYHPFNHANRFKEIDTCLADLTGQGELLCRTRMRGCSNLIDMGL